MNVIVSNKQKEVLDNANIDAIKDLYGLFNVEDLINNFRNYFFSKMIIDATSIIDFTKPETLKKLIDGIGSEKLIILLPKKPAPPREFLEFLTTLKIYNFTSDANEIVKLVQNPNTYETVKTHIENNQMVPNNMISSGIIDNNQVIAQNNSTNGEYPRTNNSSSKVILGFKNVTVHAGSTSLIFMIKQMLEKKYGRNVLAVEVNTNDFVYFRNENMISVTPNNLENVIKNYIADIILVDLGNSNYDSVCTEVLYLVEPSVIKINKLMAENRKIFSELIGKKVVLNKSLLSSADIEIFSHEAGTRIFFNIPPLNDRVGNGILDNLLTKLNIINDNGKKGFLGVFK